jgi:hypothetical protein
VIIALPLSIALVALAALRVWPNVHASTHGPSTFGRRTTGHPTKKPATNQTPSDLGTWSTLPVRAGHSFTPEELVALYERHGDEVEPTRTRPWPKYRWAR